MTSTLKDALRARRIAKREAKAIASPPEIDPIETGVFGEVFLDYENMRPGRLYKGELTGQAIYVRRLRSGAIEVLTTQSEIAANPSNTGRR